MDITGFSIPNEMAFGRDCCLGTIMSDRTSLLVGDEVTCSCGSVIRCDGEKSIKLSSIGDAEHVLISYPFCKTDEDGIFVNTIYRDPKTGAMRQVESKG